MLVSAEWNRRQSNKLNRFIRNARFAVPSATVEGIEYHEDRKLDKAQMLRFATCQYIDEATTLSSREPLVTARLALPAFAADDPLVVVENLSTFIFSLIRAVGLILLGWGIVQVGLSLQSHDPSQRSQGFLTLAGGW